MKKRFAKIALGLTASALFMMTAHVFTHAFSATQEGIAQCRFCQSLAGLSAPGTPVAAPVPVLAAGSPSFIPSVVPVLSSDTRPARAPPLI